MPIRSLVGRESKITQHDEKRLDAKLLSLVFISDVLLCVYLFWFRDFIINSLFFSFFFFLQEKTMWLLQSAACAFDI